MKMWIWVVGLGLTASACGTASAVDGDLVLPCDTSYLFLGGAGASFYATATAEELPGAFTAFYCDYVDQAERPVELPSLCVQGPECASASNVVCRMAEASTINLLEDGTYWFECGNTGADNRATTVRILR